MARSTKPKPFPPIPSDPSELRQPDGSRFWEIPISYELIYYCTFASDLLMTWTMIALAEREDKGLGLPPRPQWRIEIMAGQETEEFEANVRVLARDGFLTIMPDGTLRVPWGRLYQESVLSALALTEQIDALRASAAPAPLARQRGLDL